MATKEKDYNKIAATKIQRPAELEKQRRERPPKFLIYSRNKKGKTFFCTSAGVDNCLFADPEGGTDLMVKKNPHVWPIHRWSDINDYYQFLRGGDHEYTVAAVDGLTRLSNMALRHVMRIQEERSLDRQPGLVQRQDYGKAGELMKEMLINFHNLNMTVIYTAQERQVEGSDAEEDEDSEENESMYVPDLPKGVRGHVNSLVDVIGRLYVVKVNVKGVERSQRRLWIGESTKYDTGYRSDYAPLPEMVKVPTIPKLTNLIRTGSTRGEVNG